MADKSNEAAQAAGNAAYDRAEESHWPPTQADTEAIGAAAGAAAGAVIGGPVGATVGGLVGTAVGSAVYSLAGAIANGLDPRGPSDAGLYVYNANQFAANIRATQAKLAQQCRTDEEHELDELVRWGLDWNNAQWRHRRLVDEVGKDRAYQILAAAEKTAFKAASARTAECETYRRAKAPQLRDASQVHRARAPQLRDASQVHRGAGIGTVIVAAAGLGGAIWLASLL